MEYTKLYAIEPLQLRVTDVSSTKTCNFISDSLFFIRRSLWDTLFNKLPSTNYFLNLEIKIIQSQASFISTRTRVSSF